MRTMSKGRMLPRSDALAREEMHRETFRQCPAPDGSGTRTTSDCKAIGAAAPFFTCQNRIALHGSRRECARDPCHTGRCDHAATSLPDVQGAPSRHGFKDWPRYGSPGNLNRGIALPGNRSRRQADVSHKVIEKRPPKSGFSFHSPVRPMAATVHPVLFNNQNCRS